MKCQYCDDVAVVNIAWFNANRVDDEVVCSNHHLLIRIILDEMQEFVKAVEFS